MYRIALIDMPFASIQSPSIALTQIKNILECSFPGKIAVQVLYLKNDFATYMGPDLYQYVATSMQSLNAGLGEWLFRAAAFPGLPDNCEQYTGRYPVTPTAMAVAISELITEKRPRFQNFLSKLIYKYQLDEADLVGFTSMFMQNTAIFGMARLLKECNPRVSIAMGGANCEYPMGLAIAKWIKDIDYVFSGPALVSFPQFVGRCLERDYAACRHIRGVMCKDMVTGGCSDAVSGEDLSIDTIIDLDYDSFLDEFHQRFRGGQISCALPFETSRGCWWGQRAHCTFCGLNGASMTYRSMKAELAIEQIRKLFRYVGRAQQLTAVDNILPKSYCREVLPHLMPPQGIELFYEVKADLSEEEIASLSNAKVTQIQPGIESLATSTLKLMKKGTTSFQNIGLLKSCVQYGIEPYWNLLIGFPGESEEVYRRYADVIPQLAHLPPPTGVYPVRFDRFSPYFYKAEEYGLSLVPLDYYFFIYPFPTPDIETFAYYFRDNNLNAEYFVSTVKWIDTISARIDEWKSKWARKDGSTPPALNFKNTTAGPVICDSRFGTPSDHPLNPVGKAILKHLSKPMRIQALMERMQVECIESEISILKERGLIFEEDQRLLSLVLEPTRLELSLGASEHAMQGGIEATVLGDLHE